LSDNLIVQLGAATDALNSRGRLSDPSYRFKRFTS
jgi:hypothetical protein